MDSASHHTRRCVAGLALLVSLLVAAPALAQVDYLKNSGNRLGVGLNGIVTGVADPFASSVQPPEGFSDLPGGVVIQYPLGLLQGTMLGVWRIIGGGFDLATFWAPFSLSSPEPRFMLIPGVEHDGF